MIKNDLFEIYGDRQLSPDESQAWCHMAACQQPSENWQMPEEVTQAYEAAKEKYEMVYPARISVPGASALGGKVSLSEGVLLAEHGNRKYLLARWKMSGVEPLTEERALIGKFHEALRGRAENESALNTGYLSLFTALIALFGVLFTTNTPTLTPGIVLCGIATLLGWLLYRQGTAPPMPINIAEEEAMRSAKRLLGLSLPPSRVRVGMLFCWLIFGALNAFSAGVFVMLLLILITIPPVGIELVSLEIPTMGAISIAIGAVACAVTLHKLRFILNEALPRTRA